MTIYRIKSITFAGSQGGYSYTVGQGFGEHYIDKIVTRQLYLNNRERTFYVGVNKDDQMVFQANARNSSIVVEYDHGKNDPSKFSTVDADLLNKIRENQGKMINKLQSQMMDYQSALVAISNHCCDPQEKANEVLKKYMI